MHGAPDGVGGRDACHRLACVDSYRVVKTK